MEYDVIVIGGGIVGVASAWQLKQQYPLKKVLLLEKETQVACHQTGRNSGVIHAGVYYEPGSLKAKYCRQGHQETMEFCQQNNIKVEQCGKLLVATSLSEEVAMEVLYERCLQNQLTPKRLSQAQLQQQEPNIKGTGAVLISQTAIVNYKVLTQAMLEHYLNLGGEVAFGQNIIGLDESDTQVRVQTNKQQFKARLLVACGGLMADRLIAMLGVVPDFRIVPFRGEYFRLSSRLNHIVKHLIYPIPDPSLPFLGVHLTKMIDGSVTVGPNAVLAWKREGYHKMDFSLKELTQLLSFKGFWPLIGKYGLSGMTEMKNSICKSGYLRRVQKYCPSLTLDDLQPYPSGVRAQAVSDRGELIHDFKFVETSHSLHVGNAPSPAATAAIPIAKSIVERLAAKLDS